MTGHGGQRVWKNSKQETDQTVLTITKALINTTNCTLCRVKKVEGHDKIFPHQSRAPTCKFVPAPVGALLLQRVSVLVERFNAVLLHDTFPAVWQETAGDDQR